MKIEDRRSLNLWLVAEIEDELDCQWVEVRELTRLQQGLSRGFDAGIHTAEESARIGAALSRAAVLLERHEKERRFGQ